MKAKWFSFFRDEKGVAMIEFAITLPVLILLTLGAYDLHRYIDVNQKLEAAAYQVADLLSNNISLNAAQMQALMSSAEIIIYPYESAPRLGIIVTSVFNNGTQNNVQIQQATGNVSISDSLVAPGGVGSAAEVNYPMITDDQVVAVEIFYTYDTTFGIEIGDAFMDSDRIYKSAISRPRYGGLLETD